MSKPVQVKFGPDEIAVKVGQLVLQVWAAEAKIRALEVRVDELDPPEEKLDASV